MRRESDELRDMIAPIEDVPPMPEDTHERCMHAVRATPQSAIRPVNQWRRMISVAAALVFVIGGTALTRDQLNPPTATDNGMVMYSRTESAPSGINSKARTMGASDMGAGMANYAADTIAAQEESRKLIRTVSLSIGSRRYEESLAAILAACETAGGWVESRSESADSQRSAWLELRIPADQLDAFLSAASDWGRISHRSEHTQDVTESYQDTAARLETQQALMERFQALMTETGDLSDLLALENQIADTQYEIDRLQGILLNTDRQVDYATVSVSLQEESSRDDAENPELSLWQRMAGGLATGGRFVVQWAQDILVFLASASPFLLAAGGGWIIVRLLRRKK